MVRDEHRLLRLSRLRVGQRLVLTKALGTGVVFHADMRALARGPWLLAALQSVTHSSAPALAILRGAGVEAATDVTGFGLIGHLGEMLRASGVSAVVDLDRVPLSPAAAKAVRADPGLIDRIVTGGDDYEILCAVPEKNVDSLRAAAERCGMALSIIGRVVSGHEAPVFRTETGERRYDGGSFSHF